MFLFNTDCTIDIKCENTDADARVELIPDGENIVVYLTADESLPMAAELTWHIKSDKNFLVMGDAWERSYGELEWKKLSENNRPMPWYFLVSDGTDTCGYGVKTQPNSFVCFYYNENMMKAVFDCRNGGGGVALRGRRILLGTLISVAYNNMRAFTAAGKFCHAMCDNCIMPDRIVYGGNNWYYAYGKSSREEILSDTAIQVQMSVGTDNPPFMVIDDCWQINKCAGPWLPNEKFGDMKTLAQEIKAMGARPGIWVRFLYNLGDNVTDSMKIDRNGEKLYLDPTIPEVCEIIRNDIKRVKSWGYELIKHDFTTYDLFGSFGKDLSCSITNFSGWHFADRTKTNAEITLGLYRLIKQECGDTLVIGCNTVSHLAAGLVEINRTGDDTSGESWERTKKMGVNTLAFRLAQHGAFYTVDADCVGILKENIPWEKNRQWLELLARSATAVFVSCDKNITEDKKRDISAAYKLAQSDNLYAEPLDWLENITPEKWILNGEEVKFSW